MNRVANIALAVLAVVVVGAAAYVIANNKAPKNQRHPAAVGSQAAQRTPVVTIGPGPTLGVDATASHSTASQSTASQSSASQTAGAAPVVAFLGDDWTAGIGASAKAKRFTTLVCSKLQLTERNFGVDGAGYAKGGAGGDSYRSQVAKIVAAAPSLVVVTGGRNDYSDDATTTAAAVHTLFAQLHEKLPAAKLVAIAPFWGDSDLPPEMIALSSAVKSGVTDAGGTYLDLPDPIHGHPDYMADDADPDNAGYAAIAAALEPALSPLLPH